MHVALLHKFPTLLCLVRGARWATSTCRACRAASPSPTPPPWRPTTPGGSRPRSSPARCEQPLNILGLPAHAWAVPNRDAICIILKKVSPDTRRAEHARCLLHARLLNGCIQTPHASWILGLVCQRASAALCRSTPRRGTSSPSEWCSGSSSPGSCPGRSSAPSRRGHAR